MHGMRRHEFVACFFFFCEAATNNQSAPSNNNNNNNNAHRDHDTKSRGSAVYVFVVFTKYGVFFSLSFSPAQPTAVGGLTLNAAQRPPTAGSTAFFFRTTDKSRAHGHQEVGPPPPDGTCLHFSRALYRRVL